MISVKWRKVSLFQNAEGEVERMEAAPEDEGPRGAVPKSGKKEDDPRVENDARQNATRAAERNVHVVAEPSRKRDVPVAPEVAEGLREIRTIEVHHQLDAEKLADANRTVRVAGEVAINLERVKDHADEASDRRVKLRILEGEIDIHRQQVGNDHLLEESVDDEPNAFHPLLVLKAARRGELREHLRSSSDRPGDDLREEGEVCERGENS